MKVLIAEDDAVFRKSLLRKLSQWGYSVTDVADGRLAWEALRVPDGPRLAVLDWMMPELDGIDLIKRLRKSETTAAVYIILLTAKEALRDIVEGLDAGADDYIAKPADFGELKARLNVGRRVLELQKALAEQEKIRATIETTGTVCHEMNQPMQVISGTAELLMLEVPEDSPIYQRLETIKSHVGMMGEITRKLMGITWYKI